MYSNRPGIVSIIAALCSMGRTNRYELPVRLRSSYKRGGGRARRRYTQGRGDRKIPGRLRIAGKYFREHPELCRKAA